MENRNYKTISVCLAALLIMGAVFTGARAISDSRAEPGVDPDRLAALAGPLHESAVSLSEGSGSLLDSAETLSSGLNSLAESNELLTGEAQRAFYVLLDSGDRQIAALGFEAPELTALNYDQVLDSLSAQPGGEELGQLKRELDSFVQFYTDLTDYTESVALASRGARTIEEGLGSVESLAGAMAESTSRLFGGEAKAETENSFYGTADCSGEEIRFA